jgi:hypothetical protein
VIEALRTSTQERAAVTGQLLDRVAKVIASIDAVLKLTTDEPA